MLSLKSRLFTRRLPQFPKLTDPLPSPVEDVVAVQAARLNAALDDVSKVTLQC